MDLELEILDFQMRMLQCTIEMNGMIAENKEREMNDNSISYGEKEFMELVDKHGVHANQFPRYKG